MKEIWINFHECEHDGDLDTYKNDIRNAGGKILSSEINYDEESAVVHIEIDDSFMHKFKGTDSFGFSNLSI